MNRDLKRIIRYNRDALEASEKDLKSIFEIMFRPKDNVLWERNDGFRIEKGTYGSARDQIISAASALYAKLGAAHSYIALELDNGPEWIVAFWAILMSGNKPYLVNLRYPHSLSNGILKTLNIQYVICRRSSALQAQAIPVESLVGDFAPVPEDVFENEIAFSSSATSMNEVVCFYTGKQIAEQILNFKAIVKENPRIAKHYKGSLKQLAFLPFYHVFGLFAVYFWFTFFGRTLVFLRDYAADTILKTCRRHNVTHIFAVPMLWHTVEQQIWATAKEQGEKKEKKLRSGLKLMTALQNLCPRIGPEIAKWATREVTDRLFGRSVMFCISGGSYLRDSAMELMNGIGYSMHNGFGMSEIGITSVELRRRPKHRNLNSIGHPFTAVEYQLDENGGLLVRGSSLCVRKLVNGQETKFSGWFETGDNMGCADDGHYYILGRKGDMVIGENGENINPDTVEKFFVLTGAKMLSVLGLEGENGQELSLVVQLSPYATERSISEIKNEAYAINETLPATAAVRKFYFTVDELAPPTAIKVGRKQLLKKIADGQVRLTPFADMVIAECAEGEQSPLQQQICSIIAQILGIPVEQVGVDAHIFYDLGASSIQYFSVLSALSEHFSIAEYDKNEKYRYTPREICEYIERFL